MPGIAGIPVSDADVLRLVVLLRKAELPDTAEKLERAAELETRVLALTITDRESILQALADVRRTGSPSSASVLLREHEWRVREVLA